MKNLILFTITILLTSFSCKAQTVIYDVTATPEQITGNSYYIKDISNQFDVVLGVWKWEEGNSYFEITLQKFEMESYSTLSTKFYDRIYGKYKYVENGVVIAEVSEIVPYPNFKLILTFDTPLIYKVGIKDIVSGKGKSGEFTITAPNTATLELWDSGGVRIGGNVSLLPFSLPTSVVLTKQ